MALAQRLCVLILLLGAASSAASTNSTNYSPFVWQECLDRSNISADLRRAGARSWEVEAIEIIGSGSIGKGPVDVVHVSRDEIALGWAHFTAQRSPFELNTWTGSASAEWVLGIQALLYSDQAPFIQLRSWRRIVRSTARMGASQGCRDHECRVLLVAMANSSPRRAQRIGSECRWRAPCMAQRYPGSSAHRQRRIDEWRRRMRGRD